MSDVALNCTLGGQAQDVFASKGFLRLRQRGPWTSYLECSSKLAPVAGSPATVVVRREDGTLDSFVGTVRRAAVNPGSESLKVSVVAGAGKLLAQLPPLEHVQGANGIPAGVIARAIADGAGETLAPGVEAALDATLLPRWHRAQDVTGATAFDLLADALGYVWRHLSSGLVWIGAETWPVVAATTAGAYWTGLVEDDGVTTYTVRGAPFLPGQSVGGANVIDARYEVAGALEVELRSAVAGDPPHITDANLYRTSWSATVKASNADGTIDVTCDDARMGDLRSLQVRVGIPGASVTVPAGARVRVRFDGASPKGAFAEGIDQDSTAALSVALASGFLYGVVGAGNLTALYFSPANGVASSWSLIASGAIPPANGVTSGTGITVGSAGVRLK